MKVKLYGLVIQWVFGSPSSDIADMEEGQEFSFSRSGAKASFSPSLNNQYYLMRNSSRGCFLAKHLRCSRTETMTIPFVY
jgi:hypothetical protein